jgi:membrane complex biogenesis BtpA family protein
MSNLDTKQVPVLERLFGNKKPIIGMVHVLPLPGSPYFKSGSLQAVYDQAVEEALILEQGGVDAILLENAGDIPFLKPDDIGFETVGAMSVVGDRIRRAIKLPLGFNIVANAAKASLACAKSSGAQFVRVNQWANAYVANEGIVEGAAAQALRYRKMLDAEDIVVLADVHVKHGSHAIVGDRDIEDQARDVEFFGADILIATGTRTGHPTAPSEVTQIRAGANNPVLVGSGFSSDNAAELLSVADGAIVGSYVKGNGKMHGDRVVLSKVQHLMDAVRKAR